MRTAGRRISAAPQIYTGGCRKWEDFLPAFLPERLSEWVLPCLTSVPSDGQREWQKAWLTAFMGFTSEGEVDCRSKVRFAPQTPPPFAQGRLFKV